MGRPTLPLVHGSYLGYVKGCRCPTCAAAHRAYMREYNQRRRAEGRMPEQHDPPRLTFSETDAPTAMQSCDCSLAGWDPPWCWSWVPWKPFSEMTTTPTAGDAHWEHLRSVWSPRRQRFITRFW
jgi:hypothetical protein